MPTPEDTSSTSEIMQKAMVCFKAGHYQEALNYYQSVLASNPEHPTANHNVGAIALQLNRPGDALGYFNRALKGDPSNDQHWVSLVQTLATTQQTALAKDLLEQAEKHGVAAESIARMKAVTHPTNIVCVQSETEKKPDELNLPPSTLSPNERLLAPEPQRKNLWQLLQRSDFPKLEKQALALSRQYPGDPRIHEVLGQCHFHRGDHALACTSFEAAISLDPDTLSYVHNLARTYTAMARYYEAVAAYKRALTLAENNAELMLALGEALRNCYRLDDAAALYESMVEQNFLPVEALNKLGLIRRQQYRPTEAKNHFNRAIEMAPEQSLAFANLGALLTELGDFNEATLAFQQSLERQPDDVTTLLNLALTFTRMGQPDQAIPQLRQAIRLAPDSAKPYLFLSEASPFSSGSDDFQALKQLSESRTATEYDQSLAYFIMGDVFLTESRDQAAFEAYKAGNSRANKDISKEANICQQAETIAKSMDSRFFNIRKPMGNESEQPVLISGMPRSGKSLLERLIGHSPEVATARELTELKKMLPGQGDAAHLFRHAQSMTRKQFNQQSGILLGALQGATNGGARYITETTPKTMVMSYYAQLFPRAPVIFCARNPWDLLATCYFKFFQHGNEYAFDIAALEQHINAENMLMAHWLKVLPNPCLKISYEDLVSNPLQVGQQVAGFLGIDWNDDFANNCLVTKTARNHSPELSAIHSQDYNAGPVKFSEEHIGFGERFKDYFIPYLSSKNPFSSIE